MQDSMSLAGLGVTLTEQHARSARPDAPVVVDRPRRRRRWGRRAPRAE